ncbi:hypothetical protein V6N13_039789 [Hibiscus sabdariffa]
MAEHSRDCAPDVMDVRDFPQLVAATNEGGASNGSGSVNPLGVAACGKLKPKVKGGKKKGKGRGANVKGCVVGESTPL